MDGVRVRVSLGEAVSTRGHRAFPGRGFRWAGSSLGLALFWVGGAFPGLELLGGALQGYDLLWARLSLDWACSGWVGPSLGRAFPGRDLLSAGRLQPRPLAWAQFYATLSAEALSHILEVPAVGWVSKASAHGSEVWVCY